MQHGHKQAMNERRLTIYQRDMGEHLPFFFFPQFILIEYIAQATRMHPEMAFLQGIHLLYIVHIIIFIFW